MAEEKKEMPEGVVVQYGNCRFCGQTVAINGIREEDEEILDKWATDKCDCSEAKEERERKKAEEKAVQNVKKLFGEYDAGAVLMAAVHPVAIAAINSVTVDVDDGVKGKVFQDKNGKVKVRKVITTTDEL